mmetsp:Transcript_42170/g.126300  ORF Transcript_42170/g.126300 Transcript_42170/m.126300 type:complete len:328 (+) Transcript_42170:1950-2933(+)
MHAHDPVEEVDRVVDCAVLQLEAASVLQRQVHDLRALLQHHRVVHELAGCACALARTHSAEGGTAARSQSRIMGDERLQRQLLADEALLHEDQVRQAWSQQPLVQLVAGGADQQAVDHARDLEGRARAAEKHPQRVLRRRQQVQLARLLGLVHLEQNALTEEAFATGVCLGVQLRQPPQYRDDDGASRPTRGTVLHRVRRGARVDEHATLPCLVGDGPHLQRARLRDKHAALPQNLQQAVERRRVGRASVHRHHLNRLQRALPLAAALVRRQQLRVGNVVRLAALALHLVEKCGGTLPLSIAVRADRDERVVGHHVGAAALDMHLCK